ncbi:uncharacterized protein LOC143230083 isoform X4 [Tachypleus tridentatus]|uniref:uncharacterized protein LOC143230083 isoform X4 n=1 Tax=Tachypleus tridentatus TaxID=6853 RepID=UPI003FD3B3BD
MSEVITGKECQIGLTSFICILGCLRAMMTLEDFIIREKEKLKIEKQQLELHIQMCYNIRKLKKEHLEDSGDSCDSIEKQFLTSTVPVSQIKNGSTMIASNRRTILPVDDVEDFGLPLSNDLERRRQLAEEKRKEYNRFLKGSNRRTILSVGDVEDFGLPLSNDLERRRQLAEERRKEYNRFLKEKEDKDSFMRLQKTAVARSPKEPKQQTFLDYEQILRQKKLDENKYREINGFAAVDDSELIRLQKESQKLKAEEDGFALLKLTLDDMDNSQATLRHGLRRMQPSVSAPSLNNVTASTLLCHLPGNEHKDMKYTEKEYKRQLEEQIQVYKKELEMAQKKDLENEIIGTEGYQPSFVTNSIQKPVGKNSHMEGNTSQLAYRLELEQQIQERELKKLKEKQEEENFNKWMMNDNYNPWGRSGAGAPLRDTKGNVITSRKSKIRNFGTSYSTNSSFSVTKEDQYKEELKKQIDEKKKLAAEARERESQEDEKLAKRVEEQRLRMQREYEEEVDKRKRKDEGLRLRQERLRQMQEEQQKELLKQQQEAEEKRRQEREKKERKQQQVEERAQSCSPPLRARKTQEKETATSPVTSGTPYFEPDPPVDPRHRMLGQLSEMRQQLQEEQRKMKEKLKDQKNSYKVMDQDDSSDDDNPEVTQLSRWASSGNNQVCFGRTSAPHLAMKFNHLGSSTVPQVVGKKDYNCSVPQLETLRQCCFSFNIANNYDFYSFFGYEPTKRITVTLFIDSGSILIYM